GEDGGGFLSCSGEVTAIVIQSHIGILAGCVATFRIGGDLAHPPDYPTGDVGVLVLSEEGTRVEVRLQQLRIVVGHLLEMGHDPASVHTVAMESAAQLIVHPST